MLTIVITQETKTADQMAEVLERVARLIREGYTSGQEPAWHLSGEEIASPDTVNFIVEIVNNGPLPKQLSDARALCRRRGADDTVRREINGLITEFGADADLEEVLSQI